MLVELAIHNLAVIRETRMAFGPGLNALTGETGAGKSMVIDALSAVLGARTSAEIVRTGANGAWVEAVFDISRAAARERILAALAEAGIEQDPDEPLILSRDINVAGRSTARIANQKVTAGVLARIGELLVDIHGQSDHLSLLRPSVQLDLIDHFAGTEAMREELASALDEWNRLRTRIHDFDEEQRRAAQRIDLLRFQSEELAAANVQLGEDEALQQERARLANAERLLHAAADAQTALAGDPTAPDSAGAIALLRAAGRLIGDIAAVDSSFEPVLTRTNDAVFALEDVAAEVRDYAEKVELDPRRLETVEERLDLLRRLKRKYGPTLAEVLAYANEIGTELAQLESAEHDIDALRAEEEERRLRLGEAAAELSAARRAAAQQLAREVERSIHELNMGHAVFEVRFDTQLDDEGVSLLGSERVAIDHTGIDRVVFYLATNRGEELRPLARIASGGETARLGADLVFANESVMDEVMGFDACHGQRHLGAAEAGHHLRAGIVGGATRLPQCPGLGGGHADDFVVAGEAAVIGAEQITALLGRDLAEEILPVVRENAARALAIEPVDIGLAAQEDAAQHQSEHPFGEGFGVQQGQGGAPGAAEQQPALHLQMLAHPFQVGEQVLGGVGAEFGMGAGAAGAALVDQDDAIFLGVEEAAVLFAAPGARPAVHEQDGHALVDATFLDVERVAIADIEAVAGVGTNGGIKLSHSPAPLRLG